MSTPGAALVNLLLLLDLPARPIIGQAGLGGTPLLSVLESQSGRLVDLGSFSVHTLESGLDLAILYGAFDMPHRPTVRSGGWVIALRDRDASNRLGTPPFIADAKEVRRWLVGPSLAVPMSIVPLTRNALRAHELTTRDPGWKRSVRLRAIQLGWQPREFHGEVFAARVP